jgi:hypothetical protein
MVVLVVSSQPSAFVAIKVTVKEPLVKYPCVGLARLLVNPSPKSQAYVVAFVEVFVKPTSNVGRFADVNPATGAGLIITEVDAAVVHPF